MATATEIENFDIDNEKREPKVRSSMSINPGLHAAIHYVAEQDKRSFNQMLEMLLTDKVKEKLKELKKR